MSGLVIDGSQTVLINGLPACRLGDTVLEAVGRPNKIVGGEVNGHRGMREWRTIDFLGADGASRSCGRTRGAGSTLAVYEESVDESIGSILGPRGANEPCADFGCGIEDRGLRRPRSLMRGTAEETSAKRWCGGSGASRCSTWRRW